MRLLIFILLVVLALAYFLTDAGVFQQNRYNFNRYLDSIHAHEVRHDLIQNFFLFGFFILSIASVGEAESLILLFLCVYLYLFFKNDEKKERTLVITARIKRLICIKLCLCLLLSALINLSPLSESWIYLLMIGVYGFHHYGFLISALLAQPIEKAIRKHYRRQAEQKLAASACVKIGITGSYGKTSVKNIVNQCLATSYSCTATPLSYNNEMGITKTIREQLRLSDEMFICEMGADHVHEIEDLCEFVQPDYGIITAVGHQHLSTFKSIDHILHEKLQLAEHAKKAVFINVDNPLLRKAMIGNPIKIVTYGVDTPASYRAVNIHCDEHGSTFDLLHDGKTVSFETKLLGQHNILNCVGALALADELGVDVSLLQLAVKTLEPIPHRLQLKPFGEGRLIDNAYNSNPDSAREALKVLAMMPGRHLLITPGFIDLGEECEQYCEQFGTWMKGIDLIILIGRNANAIRRGALSVGVDEEQILEVDSMARALELASVLMHENDTILIENDIPELFLH